MNTWHLLAPIVLPAAAGALVFCLPRRLQRACGPLAAAAAAVNLALTAFLFGKQGDCSLAWGGCHLEFALRLDAFNGLIALAAGVFGFLVCIYAAAFFAPAPEARGVSAPRLRGCFFAGLLFTLGMFNGAALADNFILLLFFWESLLLPLYGMIALGRAGAHKTAVKAFVISGAADLCLMFGIGLTIHLAGTACLSQAQPPAGAWSGAAFICLLIGALGKAGAMPLHSWIPDAAGDAPLPFMALVPGALDKLLGIYFLARISLDIFPLSPASIMSPVLMSVGCATILLAVLMALIQKDCKRLLSFHAISQVGYMLLGVGTGVPAGIAGGLFHMLNNAVYKSGLFLAAGAIEKQAGTTDLSKLGGLRGAMPATFVSFVVLAASISGVPPFNGFFSKELVYLGAIEAGRSWNAGWIFYAAALLGSFFTAASFLKLGHAAFFGKKPGAAAGAREAPPAMLIPIVITASLCLLFGIWRSLPLERWIAPVLGEARAVSHESPGALLIGLSVLVLCAAAVHHAWGARRAGCGLGAADHIHNAPGLRRLYDLAERGFFDPYEIGRAIVRGFARLAWGLDRGVNCLYDIAAVRAAELLSAGVRLAHTGSLAVYLSWALAGLALAALFITGGF